MRSLKKTKPFKFTVSFSFLLYMGFYLIHNIYYAIIYVKLYSHSMHINNIIQQINTF